MHLLNQRPPPPMNPRLGHRTLSAAIVEQLRRDILDGTYAAGEQLRQDALAASFQVSRIPVREALFQLEAEGLLRIEPHKGAIVSAFSLEEIDDVFDLLDFALREEQFAVALAEGEGGFE